MLSFFQNLANFLLPFLLGSLIFFAAIVAPNTFKTLEEQNARKFIRSIFPKLYLWGGIISFLIFLCLLSFNNFFAFLMFIVFFGFVYSRQFLMKLINKAADKKNNDKNFKRLHTFSVVIFVSQLLIMLILFILL